ncbi:Ger(x)C family spore germination protein [Bacillus suaedaesalsae]|uniref:Ger(X)C family spore germination protein n=1 Tax=Bacillus suaedaesalsae TaxID=2810349 RepID=A0ABS2DJI9_9BACI|nr:Ger(x)C family spore germination protein [Bacillus suaedaesalsae]MBM6618629.1 Ger(x)C family spore germination protein [Bacillus suaedaesalsae]
MKRIRALTVILCCIFLTSCSGLKNIQDLTYIVAIGMDYNEEKKEYIAYIQGLNFANVAKQEGGKPTEPVPIFIASATGETLNLAVSKLYRKSEPPLFFGHTNTLILSERLVKHKFKEVIEEFGRNRSLRPTLRVMITKEEIQDTLNTKALFNYPAIYTVLFKKNHNEIAQDEIKPVQLMKFLRDFYEPMGVAKLPTVKIDKDSWKADKDYPVLFFDGYAVFQLQEYISNLSSDDAMFTNWLLEKKVALHHKVEVDGQLVAAVKLSSPKMKIKYEDDKQMPKFSIELSVEGDLLEKIKDVPYIELKKKIETDLNNKITALYKVGLENKIDILDAGEKWYRKNPKKYQELKETKQFYLDESSLTDIKVSVQILHFNSYKYEQRVNGGGL